jgi:flavin reductase (DIM6/NTAB) family NADH-FMN oxidoreductase RutF
MFSCGNTANKTNENTQESRPAIQKDVSEQSFDELFAAIQPAELTDNVFKLVGQDYTVITAGTEQDFNSMTASYGGWGQLFELPSTWCFLRANRYTLEYMKREKTYTMTYFADDYREQVLYYGSKSGRDSDKMKNNPLTYIKTPSGNISYREARLIIECKLMEITTVHPDDFYMEKDRKFVEDAYREAEDYHKIVFGEITGVWVKKNETADN